MFNNQTNNQTNVRRVLTHRQVLITLCILVFINISVNILMGSTEATKQQDTTKTVVGTKYIVPGQKWTEEDIFAIRSIINQQVKTQIKDFQIKAGRNGMLLVYNGNEVIDVIRKDDKCNIREIIQDYKDKTDERFEATYPGFYSGK